MSLAYVTPRRKNRLTWPDVRQIRLLYRNGQTLRAIAERYQVSPVQVHWIVMAKRWRNDPLLGPATPAPARKPHKRKLPCTTFSTPC